MTRPRTGHPRVLILILMLAVAAAAATLPPQESADAHPCTPANRTHVDSHDRPCDDPDHDGRHGRIIPVHGGRDNTFSLEVRPPSNEEGDLKSEFLDEGDQVEIPPARVLPAEARRLHRHAQREIHNPGRHQGPESGQLQAGRRDPRGPEADTHLRGVHRSETHRPHRKRDQPRNHP